MPVPGAAEPYDAFGSVLAAADFNGDGFDDLVVGVPDEDVGSISDAGCINSLRGSPLGLTAIGSEIQCQHHSGVAGSPESHDDFGSSLSVGDFNGDGRADLAVGVQGEGIGDEDDAGLVQIFHGQVSGLDPIRAIHQNTQGIELTSAEAGDAFGFAISAADFNGDGFTDLAVGSPNEGLYLSVQEIGVVHVILGTGDGLDPELATLWHQDRPGMEDSNARWDHFGYALSGLDVDGDGFADLAIGVPGEEHNGHGNEGAVQLLYTGGTILTGDSDELWHENSSGVLGVAESSDRFGMVLH